MQPSHKWVGMALEVPTTQQQKMPILDTNPLGFPDQWVISEDKCKRTKLSIQ